MKGVKTKEYSNKTEKHFSDIKKYDSRKKGNYIDKLQKKIFFKEIFQGKAYRWKTE